MNIIDYKQQLARENVEKERYLEHASGDIYFKWYDGFTAKFWGNTGIIGISCLGASVLYGFIRPIFYKPSDLVAYGSYNEGFSFQFVPFEDNLGIKLSYRKTF